MLNFDKKSCAMFRQAAALQPLFRCIRVIHGKTHAQN